MVRLDWTNQLDRTGTVLKLFTWEPCLQLHVVDDDHQEAGLLGALIHPLVAGNVHAPEEIAVLYRAHAQSRLIEQEMVSSLTG